MGTQAGEHVMAIIKPKASQPKTVSTATWSVEEGKVKVWSFKNIFAFSVKSLKWNLMKCGAYAY